MSISVHSWKQEEADLQVGRCVTAVRQSRSRESSAKHARCLNMLNKRAEEQLPLTPLHHCYGNSNVFIFYLSSLLGLWVGVTRGFRLCGDSRTCCEQAFIAALLIWWGLWPLSVLLQSNLFDMLSYGITSGTRCVVLNSLNIEIQ